MWAHAMTSYFYLLMRREDRNPEMFHRCHFFPAHYLEILMQLLNAYNKWRVNRKYKKYDVPDGPLPNHFNIPNDGFKAWLEPVRHPKKLTSCDKVFLPICKGGHWALFILYMQEEIGDIGLVLQRSYGEVPRQDFATEDFSPSSTHTLKGRHFLYRQLSNTIT